MFVFSCFSCSPPQESLRRTACGSKNRDSRPGQPVTFMTLALFTDQVFPTRVGLDADGFTPRLGKNCTLRAGKGAWPKTPCCGSRRNTAIAAVLGSFRGVDENFSFWSPPRITDWLLSEAQGQHRMPLRTWVRGLACNFSRSEE